MKISEKFDKVIRKTVLISFFVLFAFAMTMDFMPMFVRKAFTWVLLGYCAVLAGLGFWIKGNLGQP